jgi:FkbM family methyltransferase
MRYYRLLRNIANWPLFFAVKLGLVRRNPFLFVTRRGIRIEVWLRLLQTFKEIFMDEGYLRDLPLPLPENPTVIDIGANAGYFSLFALSRFDGARVYSFEPIPANFRLLQRNRELNPGQRWFCAQKAVSGQAGEALLAFDSTDEFSTGATVIAERGAIQKDRIRVPAVTLPEILEENGLERCDLIKIDCEGGEYGILYPCSPELLARFDRMALEVHVGPGPEQNVDALESFLRKNGFVTRQRPLGMLSAWRVEKRDG